LGLFYLC